MTARSRRRWRCARRYGDCGLARRSRFRRQGSEAGGHDGLAACWSIDDGREHGTHGGVRARLGHGRPGGYAGEKIGLVHSGSPLESVRLSVSRYRQSSGRAARQGTIHMVGGGVDARLGRKRREAAPRLVCPRAASRSRTRARCWGRFRGTGPWAWRL